MIQEVDLLAKLKRYHNIIRFYEKFDAEDDLWIVLELLVHLFCTINKIRCEGGSLKDDVKYRGKYSETQAATVMIQLLEALEGMHSEAICHRDLKVGGIFIDSDF